uniref:Uncharacterized protein n=1 Tax=mine drainage metagenome TaxID=410659 RepID=E6QLI6_9ZZZZ
MLVALRGKLDSEIFVMDQSQQVFRKPIWVLRRA